METWTLVKQNPDIAAKVTPNEIMSVMKDALKALLLNAWW